MPSVDLVHKMSKVHIYRPHQCNVLAPAHGVGVVNVQVTMNDELISVKKDFNFNLQTLCK